MYVLRIRLPWRNQEARSVWGGVVGWCSGGSERKRFAGGKLGCRETRPSALTRKATTLDGTPVRLKILLNEKLLLFLTSEYTQSIQCNLIHIL